jgi:hypothetical protein
MTDFSHSLSPEPIAVGAVSSAVAVHLYSHFAVLKNLKMRKAIGNITPI